MTLAYILGGGLNDQPGMGRQLYEAFPAVQDWYEQVGAWTGLTPAQVLSERPPEDHDFRQGVGAIRQAAFVIGLHDVLAAHGVLPGVVGGLSLGDMIGACLAGAVSRADFFALLNVFRRVPTRAPGSRPQGVAVAVVPADYRPEEYHAPGRPGVYVAVDLGTARNTDMRLLVLSGYRDALDAVVADHPGGLVNLLEPGYTVAFHSPLQAHVREHLTPAVLATPFHDPVLPVCSCIERRTLGTAAEVRELFLRNSEVTVSTGHVVAEMLRHRTELAIVLGPSRFDRVERFPFPAVQVSVPEDIPDALAAIYDLGIALPVLEP